MNLKSNQIKEYLKKNFKGKIGNLSIKELGSGVMGTGYLLDFTINLVTKRLVLKSIFANNLNLDHYSDRAQNFFLAHDSYNSMKNHIKSKDVISVNSQGELKSVGDSKEFFILMEEAKGQDFFKDLEKIGEQGFVDEITKKKILILSDFLVKLHSKKVGSISMYRRKTRETLAGGGSVAMILDSWPEEVYSVFKSEWKEIIKRCVDVWDSSRNLTNRNCEIHGDFHPGNLWFNEDLNLTVLDRARGISGEPADDISAFVLNPIFYSVKKYGKFEGEYKEVFDLFWNNYFSKTLDKEMRKVLGLYFAFRTSVVCHPVFYSDDFFGGKEKAEITRSKMIHFSLNVLRDKEFSPSKINEYIK